MVAVTVTANVLVTDLVGSTLVLSRQGESAADEVAPAPRRTRVATWSGSSRARSSRAPGTARWRCFRRLTCSCAPARRSPRRHGATGMALRVGLASGDVDANGCRLLRRSGRHRHPLVRQRGSRPGADRTVDRRHAGTARRSAAAGPAAAHPEGLRRPTRRPRGRRPRRGRPSGRRRRRRPGSSAASEVAGVDRRLVGLGRAARSCSSASRGSARRASPERACSSDERRRPIWVSFEPTVSDGFSHLVHRHRRARRATREIGPVAALGRELRRAAPQPTCRRWPIASRSTRSRPTTTIGPASSTPSSRSPVHSARRRSWCSTTSNGPAGRRSPCCNGSRRQRPRCACWRPVGRRCPLRWTASTATSSTSAASRLDDLEAMLRAQGLRQRTSPTALPGRAPGTPCWPLAAAGTGPGRASTRSPRGSSASPPDDVAIIGVGRAHRSPGRRAAAHDACTGRRRDACRGGAGRRRRRGHPARRRPGWRSCSSTTSSARPRSASSLRTDVPRSHAAIADVLEDRGDLLGAVPHLLDGFAALEPETRRRPGPDRVRGRWTDGAPTRTS